MQNFRDVGHASKNVAFMSKNDMKASTVDILVKIAGGLHGIVGLFLLPAFILNLIYGPAFTDAGRSASAYDIAFLCFQVFNLFLCFLIMYLVGTLKSWGRYLAIIYDSLWLAYLSFILLRILMIDPQQLVAPRILFILIPVSMLGYIIFFLLRPEVTGLMRKGMD